MKRLTYERRLLAKHILTNLLRYPFGQPRQ